ncbi:glycosyl transferase family 2 [Gloeothece citriformis PCC 7424]|uniref:Glycosyl transferase family 2 n=1 Tax=Gloeothece citriformis (strain PCC 7424) TaxID=65393 RepID=B7K6R4_GLOC7|nr:glycosyltransferase family 2 protein [Gloeothece citriformis]ACK72613.1 glycosyl transferase family 2 [Gloeothece citriformis PCC 7424]
MSRFELVTHLPLVSVIIPAYNAEKFIERTLRSVLSQTYQNIEVLVIDDGSQDKTAEIVQTIANQDQRVILLRQANSGVAAARNLGIQNAKGEFIAPIDADDIWYPENIEKQVQCMLEGGTSVGLVYSWSVDIDENDQLTGAFRVAEIEGDVYGTLVCHYFLGNASCALIRRTCLEEVSSYNCQFKTHNLQGCEDWELALRIAENYQFKAVRDFLVGYRKLPGTMSSNYQVMSRSHGFLLDIVAQRQPNLPALISRLSKSNLYLYFARLSYFQEDYPATLFWIKAVLKEDYSALLIRTQLYKLTVLSLLKQAFPQLKQFKGKPPQLSRLTLADIQQKKILIVLMLTIENIYHQIVTLICAKRSFKQNSCLVPQSE